MSIYRLGVTSAFSGLTGFACMMWYCTEPTFKCFTEPVCRDTLNCVRNANATEPGSMLNCEVEEAMKGKIDDFTTLTECIYSNECQP